MGQNLAWLGPPLQSPLLGWNPASAGAAFPLGIITLTRVPVGGRPQLLPHGLLHRAARNSLVGFPKSHG